MAKLGNLPPPPLYPQCKLKALLATQHICSSSPQRFIYCSCAIRDQRSQIRMSHEYIAPRFDQHRERKIARCLSEWAGCVKKKARRAFIYFLLPSKIHLAINMYSRRCPLHTEIWSINSPARAQHNPSSCHAAQHPCIHHVLWCTQGHSIMKGSFNC